MALPLNSGSQSEKRIVSIRKVEANRRNALKSTGPKTLKGKAYSRQNSLKHGLFVGNVLDFETLRENPEQYADLLNGLREQYEPVGRAEEVEVERIALCYWRLKRAARYEHATNLVAQRDHGRMKEFVDRFEDCEEKDKTETAVILQLQTAKAQIEDTGEISQEVKQRIFALSPPIEKLFLAYDQVFGERIKELCSPGGFPTPSPQMRARIIAKGTVANTIAFLEQDRGRKWNEAMEIAVGQNAIPNGEALDRLLRYETTIERSLTRALDRLDRMQKHRKEELISSPVNGRFTQ